MQQRFKTYNPPASRMAFTLIDIAIGFVVTGIVAGLTLGTHDIIKTSRLKSQIAQIEVFNQSVKNFYSKYEGLPGDLLAAQADKEGMIAGDGTPSHSDGDGKIAPCNLGWQWHLGCENALFWSQLSVTGMIEGDFKADKWITDSRLENTHNLASYIPVSAISEDIFITVWNSDEAQKSPGTPLPYGNYYEISRIDGIDNETMNDSPAALTPLEARAIDEKIDDGLPFFGHIVVNGNALWPEEAWGSMAKPGEDRCVSPAGRYNTRNYLKANTPLCHIAIAMTCCEKESH